jgi:ATP-dependent helicase/nuclease subunit B
VHNDPLKNPLKTPISSLTYGHFKEFFADINAQDLVIVPNQRTAELLRDDHHAHQQTTQCHKVAANPSFKSIKDWCHELASDILRYPWRVLSQHQSEAIWSDLIDQQKKQYHVNGRIASKDIITAFDLMVLHHVSLDQAEHYANPDQLFFLSCHRQMLHTLKSKQLLLSCQLLDQIRTNIDHVILGTTNRIMFYGFDYTPPALHELQISLCQLLDVKISQVNNAQPNASCHSFPDQQSEILAMLKWADRQIKVKKSHRVVCIVPELNRSRGRIESTLKQHRRQWSRQTVFNLSAGLPLDQNPCIKSALLLLELSATHRLSLSDWSTLIRSPFWGKHHTHQEYRHLLEQKICELKLSHVNLTQAKKIEKKLYENGHLDPILNALPHTKTTLESQSPRFWVTHISSVLEKSMWPGERSLSTNEHQQTKAFHTTLNACKELSIVWPQLTLSKFLRFLSHTYQSQLFQPKSLKANVEILGLLEASAVPAQAIWVMNATAKSWPARANPTPLIPLIIQQQYCMPHTHAQQEISFYRSLMQRFANNSNHVHYSWPKVHNDIVETPSALIKNIPTSEYDTNHSETFKQVLAPSTHLSTETDTHAPPPKLQHLRNRGSSILSHQASCPFKAFATHRLYARNIEPVNQYFSAVDFGMVVHHALCLIWRQIKTQKTLIESSQQDIQNLTTKITHGCLKQHCDTYFSHMSSTTRATIVKSIHLQILEWLELEKNRPPFTVIATEKTVTTDFSGIPFKIVIDRIDCSSDLKTILIDYKTGKVSIQQWLGQTIQQPQLPLYAVTQSTPFDAVAFAQVGEPSGFLGLSKSDISVPGIKSIEQAHRLTGLRTWHDLHVFWQSGLRVLAEEFKSGYAAVEPRTNNSCTNCQAHYLCRVTDNDCL